MRLEKSFNHAKYEQVIYEKSEKHIVATSQFAAHSHSGDPSSPQEGRADATDGRCFTITLPPPNITGCLHIGHAFTSTIQDIMLRFQRQNGRIVFGQPGIDHAGIATQIIVEKKLANEGISRKEIGREVFLKEVWKWKEESGCQIFNQLRKLGMSVDWSTSRFTLDPEANAAVLEAFVRLYRDGLIYRAQRIVNWDPILKTAISDLEVMNKEEKGKLWHIKYRIVADPDKSANPEEYIVVATTRPETLFGDTAVCVHPQDQRYSHLIGKLAVVPLVNRRVPIVADEACDPQKGTGVLKVTPACSFEDFEIGQRHNLEIVEIMNEDATLNANVPEQFRGLSREAARVEAVNALSSGGLVEKIEDIVHSVPYNDRSGCLMEPRVTYQWFLDAEKLAGPAIDVVEEGKIKFIPDQWKNTYFNWMRNIQPWCLSRQIWWGHQIPIWYAPDGEFFCATTEEEAAELARQHFGRDVPLKRDEDVLDTWFSSGLWPFLTQYWPDDTEMLRVRYPNDMLVTGFDIIFFWVARMVMLGVYFMKDVPFREVYIHPLIRDEKGQKMSKSKGNVIDPLVLMEKYGTDATRFTLASLAIPGRDIRMSEELVENSRNFITKIWNAAVFLEMNGCMLSKSQKECDKARLLGLNALILHELREFMKATKGHYDNHRFDLVTQNIIKFLREVFCDVYIEGLKVCLAGAHAAESREVASFVFGEFLKVSNPVIPFVTEYLWEALAEKCERGGVEFVGEFEGTDMLLISKWAAIKEPATEDEEGWKQADLCIKLTDEIRSVRGLLNVSPAAKLKLMLKTYVDEKAADFATKKETLVRFINNNANWICALGKLSCIDVDGEQQNVLGLRIIVEGWVFYLESPPNINKDDIVSIISRKKEALLRDCELLQKKTENLAYKEARFEQWSVDHENLTLKQQEIEKINAISSELT
ncbi:MAG: valine--tRNA ligase [Holosporales bacterium]|jgi:valyl-tRNA synthetase|nr:valine--tRNA ligase [Holosporales bacterium]